MNAIFLAVSFVRFDRLLLEYSLKKCHVVSELFCRGSSVAVPRSVEHITVNGKT